MITRLLQRLHSVFNKDPKLVLALDIISPVPITITVKNNIVTATAAGHTPVTAADNTTIGELATAIASEFSAAVDVNVELSGYHACYLEEGEWTDSALELRFPTSLLFQEMSVYARLLTNQADRLKQAANQMYMTNADGEWLDYWGRDHFGVQRFSGETDNEYRQRVIHELLRPVANNKALEAIVKDSLSINCTVTDAYPITSNTDHLGRFYVTLGLNNSLDSGTKAILTDKALNTIFRYKAAGTAVVSQFTDENKVGEIVTVGEAYILKTAMTYTEDAYAPGPIRVGAGWRVGTPGLKVGQNSGMKEQVAVIVRNTNDQSIVSSALYG